MKDPSKVLEKLEMILKDDLEYFKKQMQEAIDKETQAYNEGCKDITEITILWLEHYKEVY